jgi:hypothetical protein
MSYAVRHFIGVLFCIVSLGVHGQQNSYTSGSDFNSQKYQVHVSVGQVFGSYKESKPLVQEGVLSVLIELMDLLEELPIEDRIHLFPNPFSEDLIIEYMANFWSDIHLDIYTNTGLWVEKYTLQNPMGRIRLGHLPEGTYMMRIQIPGQLDYVRKIVKIN